MKFSIKISSQNGSYEVSSELDELLNFENAVVIHDEYFTEETIENLIPQSIKVPISISESAKSLSTSEKIILQMVEKGCNKSTHLIAVGGGAVQDVATLVASIYMRGIKWSYVPTTLMAMLDSCIGGKSSINVGEYKNVVGNIYPPSSVYINPYFVETLSDIDKVSGIAEAGKICFAKSEKTFETFISVLNNSSKYQYLELAEISLTAKKWFIEIDEFDKKERKLLNFGHTFGHALEASTNFSIPHGIGVLIGMKAALLFSEIQNNALSEFIDSSIKKISKDLKQLKISKSKYESALLKDKKNSTKTQYFILPTNEGTLILSGFEKSEELALKCWISLLQGLDSLEVNYEVL